jgi:hypothetical protein
VVLDSPCTFHEGGTHTVCECHQLKRVFRTTDDPKRPRSDGAGHPHVATTTTSATTDVAAGTTIAVTTGDVASSRKTDTMSATCLPRRRQGTPTARSSRPRGRST